MQNKMLEESANEENKQMITIIKELGLRIWSKFLQMITQRKIAVITDSVEGGQKRMEVPKRDANYKEDQFRLHNVIGRSLGVFPDNMRLRLVVAKVLQSRFLEIIMTFVILLSLV